MKGNCLYCHRYTMVYPIKFWNDDSQEKYYYEKHFQEVKNIDEEEKRQFWDYYRSSERRNWLSNKQIQLWEKINLEYQGQGGRF